MKTLALILFLILNSIFALAQRHFRLDSLTDNYFYLQNVDKGNFLAIPATGLILLVDSVPTIIHIGMKETVRCAYIRLGCFAVAPENKNVSERKCQMEAQDAHVGYWADHEPELFPIVSKQFSITKPILIEFNNEDPVVYRPKIEQPHQQIDIVNLQYKKTVGQTVFLEDADSKKPYQMSKEGGIIDYTRLSNLAYTENDDLRMFLIKVGVFGLKSPAGNKNKMESRAMYRAQRLKVGAWENYDPKLNPRGNFRDTIPREQHIKITTPPAPSEPSWVDALYNDFIKWKSSLSPADKFIYRLIFSVIALIISIIILLISRKFINKYYTDEYQYKLSIIAISASLIVGLLVCVIDKIWS